MVTCPPRPRARRPWRLLAATGGGLIVAVVAAVAPAQSSLPPVTAGGVPTTPSAVLRAALAQPELAPYAPDPARATALTVDGETWVLVRGTAGALCLDLEPTTVSCATAAEVAAGRLAITTIAPPVPATELELAAARRAADRAGQSGYTLPPAQSAGRAVRRGIVADGVTAVEAIGPDGRVIARAAVRANAYRLDAGVEGQAAALRLVGEGGTSTIDTR